MTPSEVNSIIEHNRPKVIAGINENDFEDMAQRRQKLIDEGIEVF